MSEIKLSALYPFIETNIVLPIEQKIRGKEYVGFGTDNKYPDYLWNLYKDVATLQTIINGTVDYVCGDSINANKEIINNKGENIKDLIRRLTLDYLIFGGFAIQVIRSLDGSISELYTLDFMKVRSNEKNTLFYYSDDWGKWGSKALVYPKYDPKDFNPSSVYYYKGHLTRSTYPIPIWGAAVIPCEIEKSINRFHLNNINNGFMSSVVINFNNGQPDDVQKEEIERSINEKFSGYQNAGRILISYNDSTENATTIEKLDSDDFDAKYESLAIRSKEQIFSAFRCNPILFGLNYSTGFSENEYNEAYKLYNKTVIQPIQQIIIDALKSVNITVTIDPFTLTANGEQADDSTVGQMVDNRYTFYTNSI